MLDKTSGAVAYAVVKCGGFLESERHHYPVPWASLKYNPIRKAFDTDTTLAELRNGPCELDGETFDWGDRVPSLSASAILDGVEAAVRPENGMRVFPALLLLAAETLNSVLGRNRHLFRSLPGTKSGRLNPIEALRYE